MAIGGGIVPATGTSQFNELTYVTRRAFIPKLVVQIYNSTPLMAALIANSQTATGGVSSVTVPVQGAQFVNAQWSDYSGSFAQPAVQQGAYNAEFDLKLMITPVPFLGMEGVVQQDHAIIPLIEARMNDATNVMMDAMSYSLYNNTTNTQQFTGLPAAVDNGVSVPTYGNISRSTYTWWKSTQYAAGSVNPTRQNVLQYISGTVKNGAALALGLCLLWTMLVRNSTLSPRVRVLIATLTAHKPRSALLWSRVFRSIPIRTAQKVRSISSTLTTSISISMSKVSLCLRALSQLFQTGRLVMLVPFSPSLSW